MRVIFGSQNFGYDTEKSDRDHAEVVFPTLRDVMNNTMISHERKEEDGSITKVIDIRKFCYLLHKGNFSDLQILYAQEIENDEHFKWFFENREKIVRHNLPQVFSSNAGFVVTQTIYYKQTYDYKFLLRAKAFTDLLVSLTKDEPFVMCNTELRTLRRFNAPINDTELKATLDEIKDYFINSEVDQAFTERIDEECFKLLKANLKEACNE